MDSILITIKKLLGITQDYKEFDADVIIAINSVLSSLYQIGIGPEEGFVIHDDTGEWSDFFDNNKIAFLKSYVHLKVKMLFDPPSSGTHIQMINEQIKELEWRLSVSPSFE